MSSTSGPQQANEEGWWPYLQRIRAEREAANYPFMNDEEMQAHIDWMREEDRFDIMLREMDEKKWKGEFS